MDSIACNKVQPVPRKGKKKQMKGELDRLKQAEKKKRRLEKALATSAAIRSELEKKKQNKKEEQERLDEQGAAIAEAVALQVLIGEDSDDSHKILLSNDRFNQWDCSGRIDLVMGEPGRCVPYEDYSRYPLERIGWVSDSSVTGVKWSEVENNEWHPLERIGWVSESCASQLSWGEEETSDWSFSYGSLGRDVQGPRFDTEIWSTADLSAGLIAAQAVSSLQIAEDTSVNAIIFNGMLRE